ncbi:unnamed protein product, partial [Adineta steineri]
TSGRRKRNLFSWFGSFFHSSSSSNKQVTCSNAATGSSSGNQYNGCYQGQSCCQGNNSTGVLTLSCSSLSTSSSPNDSS